MTGGRNSRNQAGINFIGGCYSTWRCWDSFLTWDLEAGGRGISKIKPKVVGQ